MDSCLTGDRAERGDTAVRALSRQSFSRSFTFRSAQCDSEPQAFMYLAKRVIDRDNEGGGGIISLLIILSMMKRVTGDWAERGDIAVRARAGKALQEQPRPHRRAWHRSDFQPSTLNLKPCTLDRQPSTLDPQPPTLKLYP